MLTAKQAKYRDLRIGSHLDPSAAYRGAYNAERMSAKAISVEANRLENHPEIALAILQAQEKAADDAGINLEWWLESIKAEVANPKGNRTAALALAAKYLGVGEPERERETPANLSDYLEEARSRLRIVGNG